MRDPVLHLSGDVRMLGVKSIRKSDTRNEFVISHILQVIEVVVTHGVERAHFTVVNFSDNDSSARSAEFSRNFSYDVNPWIQRS